MKLIKSAAALLCMVGFSSSAFAAELLIVDSAAKSRGGSSAISLDIVSQGDVRGFDFIIPVPKGAKVDASKCFATLPKGFQGRCQFNEKDSEISGIAFAAEKITLSEGVHSLGTISISGRDAAKSLKVQFHAAGVDAKSLPSSVNMNSELTR